MPVECYPAMFANQTVEFRPALSKRIRVAEINKYAKIAPNFGSPSRRAKRSILSIFDFWRNAEGGPKGKQDCGFI